MNYQARSPLWHYDGLVEISERLHRSVTNPKPVSTEWQKSSIAILHSSLNFSRTTSYQ